MPSRGIILAAGRGSRMKSLTDETPKCLVQVRGVSLLDRQISALRQAGVQEIAVVTGYRREMVAARGDVEFHNAKWASTQMVSSLECADEWLRAGSCIVTYGDIFYGTEAVRLLMRSSAPIALTFDPDWRALWEARFEEVLSDAESFEMDGKGYLKRIGGKPSTIDEIQGQYMGLLKFEPAGWAEVKRIRESETEELRARRDMTTTLQQVLSAGRVPIEAVPYQGEWGEVDSEEDLDLYQR